MAEPTNKPYQDAEGREYKVGFYVSKAGDVFFFDGGYIHGQGPLPENKDLLLGAVVETITGKFNINRETAAKLTQVQIREIMKKIGKLEQTAQVPPTKSGMQEKYFKVIL